MRFHQFLSGLFIAISFLATTAFADRVSESNYLFPVQRSLTSSLFGACYMAQETESTKFKVSLRGRNLERFKKYKYLNVNFYPSATPTDRLVFILSGLGANEDSTNSKYLAWMAQQAGFAAVIMPNTFTPSFVVGVSKTGLVGVPAADALDMGEAMTAVHKSLTDVGWRFASTSVIGYSHGGVLASFLSQNKYSQSLNIKSFLLINPPLDFLSNVRMIDAWEKEFNKIGLGRLIKVGPPTQKLFKNCRRTETSEEAYRDFNHELQEIGLSQSETRGIVGKAMTNSMAEVILASQDIEDLEILPAAGMEGSVVERQQQAARERRAGRYSLEDYIRLFLMPYGLADRKNLSIEQLNSDFSLLSLLPMLKHDPRIFMMHNEDDFLLRSDDMNKIEETFGDQARIYPAGGHMGNLWHHDIQGAIRNWLQENRIN